MNNKIINKMTQLCIKAEKNGDVPISAIIIKDNKIIAYDYNKRVKNKDPFAHAEILAIKKAAKKLDTYNLIDCELISTLCPCNMCQEVIKEARIKKVYYFVEKTKENNNKIKMIKYNDNNEFDKIITDFFKRIR